MVGPPAVISIVRLAYELLLPVVTNNEAYEPFLLFVYRYCANDEESHHLCLVTVRPLSTVGYTSVVASVIHSRQWSN